MIILQKNIIGNILFYVGILVLIIGTYVAYQDATMMSEYDNFGNSVETTFEWRYFLNMLIFPTILGVVFIGLSEIIKLLERLIRNINNLQVKPVQTESLQVSKHEVHLNTETDNQWSLDEKDEEKIYDLYSDKAILEIMPSNQKGFCIVKTQDMNGPLNPSIRVVDIGGLAAKEIHNPAIAKEILASYNA